MARQLVFDWPTGVALGAEDFFVSPANASAYAMIGEPALWPEGKLVLTGPEGAGKSHLARVFAARTGAAICPATALPRDLHPSSGLVVEDLETLPRAAEEALFHLHNNLRAARLPLLLTARTPPARWPLTLPDLASRMQACTVVPIAAPDDALLRALVMKLFADRQVMPDARVVDYLAARIERSYAAAARVVAALDRAALEHRRPVTVALARAVLEGDGEAPAGMS